MSCLNDKGLCILEWNEDAENNPRPMDPFAASFEEYKQMAIAKGFLMVSSSPLTRSSYHASEDFRVMQENRASKNKKG